MVSQDGSVSTSAFYTAWGFLMNVMFLDGGSKARARCFSLFTLIAKDWANVGDCWWQVHTQLAPQGLRRMGAAWVVGLLDHCFPQVSQRPLGGPLVLPKSSTGWAPPRPTSNREPPKLSANWGGACCLQGAGRMCGASSYNLFLHFLLSFPEVYSSPSLSSVLLSEVSVTHSQLWSGNINLKIPEISNF